MLSRPETGLPSFVETDLAIAALAGQGQYGVVTNLAEELGLIRQKVYKVRDFARSVLESAFDGELDTVDAENIICVTPRRIERAVIALRTVTPSSIRDIEDLLPQLFDVHWSYGKIQSLLVEAGERAARVLAQVDLRGIEHVALDEMFSQDRPVFAGIDPHSQYLFLLSLQEGRKGEEWADVLSSLRDEQGLEPSSCVKDGGTGLAKGVTTCWPDIESYDDVFHSKRDVGAVSYYLERRAYRCIRREYELETKRSRAKNETERREVGQKWRRAKVVALDAIERYDAFEQLRNRLKDILQFAHPGSGILHKSGEVEEEVRSIGTEMLGLGDKRARKVGRYLVNRAPGLARHFNELGTRLGAMVDVAGGEGLSRAAVRLYQAHLDLENETSSLTNEGRRAEMRKAIRALVECAGGKADRVRRAVLAVATVLDRRHRASSAIENFNSVLRPYLVVQKSAQQNFLDLFRFWWNTRTRRWGRGAGTSAYQELTGEPVGDWLTLLGYPPDTAPTKTSRLN